MGISRCLVRVNRSSPWLLVSREEYEEIVGMDGESIGSNKASEREAEESRSARARKTEAVPSAKKVEERNLDHAVLTRRCEAFPIRIQPASGPEARCSGPEVFLQKPG